MTEDQKVELGRRIVVARKRKGMSQVKLATVLAERFGREPESIRRSLVNNERGANAPRLHTLEAIAEATEQPISFFLGGLEDASPSPFPAEAA